MNRLSLRTATSSSATTRALPRQPIASPLDAFFRVVGAWRERYEQARQHEVLRSLDDATLRDIGYTRDALGTRDSA